MFDEVFIKLIESCRKWRDRHWVTVKVVTPSRMEVWIGRAIMSVASLLAIGLMAFVSSWTYAYVAHEATAARHPDTAQSQANNDGKLPDKEAPKSANPRQGVNPFHDKFIPAKRGESQLECGTPAENATNNAPVFVQNGNIFYAVGKKTIQLTHSGKDDRPVLSPDQRRVAFTRESPKEAGGWGMLPALTPQFIKDDFKGQFTASNLITAITADGIRVPKAPSEIESLNKLLEENTLQSRYPQKDVPKTLEEAVESNRRILEAVYPQKCPTVGRREEPRADQLWLVNIDGKDETMLVQDRMGEPETEINLIFAMQFSPDSQKIYFMTGGWATSWAVHCVNVDGTGEHFVVDSNYLKVIEKGEYKGKLIVSRHKYFMFGGSYDWCYIVTPKGKEIGPLADDEKNIPWEDLYREPEKKVGK